jgi:hypothetical protein
VEGILESAVEAVLWAQPSVHVSATLVPLLELWDGVCCLFLGRAKPAPWVNLIMRAAKAFTPEQRGAAAEAAEVRGRHSVVSSPASQLLRLVRSCAFLPMGGATALWCRYEAR